MLLRLGDLSRDEIAARCADPAAADDWIATMVQERRAIDVRIAGETRFIAAEDAGRYRDALGVALPLGLPDAFLESEPDPLSSLARRYARTHGPFASGELAHRFGIVAGSAIETLRRLAEAGTVVEGMFRPGASGSDWCDTGVLRTLRGRSLARLRREVEPVDQEAPGRFAAPRRGARWLRPRAGGSALGSGLGGRGDERHVPRRARADRPAPAVAARRCPEPRPSDAHPEPRAVFGPRRRRRPLVAHVRGRGRALDPNRARGRADPRAPRAARRADP